MAIVTCLLPIKCQKVTSLSKLVLQVRLIICQSVAVGIPSGVRLQLTPPHPTTLPVIKSTNRYKIQGSHCISKVTKVSIIYVGFRCWLLFTSNITQLKYIVGRHLPWELLSSYSRWNSLWCAQSDIDPILWNSVMLRALWAIRGVSRAPKGSPHTPHTPVRR